MNNIRVWLQRLILAGVLGPMLLIISLSPAGASSGGKNVDFVIGQIVVKLNPAANATIDDINATYSTTTIRNVLASSGIYLLQAPPGTGAKDVIGAMEDDVRLLFAELNFLAETPEPDRSSSHAWGGQNDTPFSKQYAVGLLNLARAHEISRGDGAVVAVLDTGVQLDHPALAASLTTTGFDFVDDDSEAEDEFNGLDAVHEVAGHGTHVAGTIHLVAPEAKIMPVRVLDVNGQGNIFTLAEAILYAIDKGADVINLSLGMPEKSELLREATRQATLNGVVVVAAAGNLNGMKQQHPAAAQCALAITSIGPESKKSPFANFGGWIAFAAPGEGIYSTFPVDGYATWSGTSMATPFVAGQAALIDSFAPSLTARQVAMLIGGTARSLNGSNPNLEGRLGAGLVDIGTSLERLQTGNLPDHGGGLLSRSCIRDGDGA